MGQKEYIVALDLGTSKMLAMAATKKDGSLLILGTQKTASENCIRRGCIYNIEETSKKITSLVNDLNSSLTPKIKQVYVGIGGQSLRTKDHTVWKEFNSKTTITDEIVDSLYEECNKYVPEFAEILEIASAEFYLDGRLEANPKGLECDNIEAKFLLILGNPSLKRAVKTSMEKVNVKIAGFFVSPLATAEAVLSSREKKLGCALVEFGAGITYLSFYKDGLLKYMIAIPLGGNVITKDICDMKLEENEAEELKIKEGNALIDPEKSELNTIVEARIIEIIANIQHQIKESNYDSALSEGIIITGGGSLLKNVDRLLSQKTGKQVRKANAEDPTQECARGLLLFGNENCAEEIVPPTANPQPDTDLFGNPIPKTEEKKKKEKKVGFFDILKQGTKEVADKAGKAATGFFDE